MISRPAVQGGAGWRQVYVSPSGPEVLQHPLLRGYQLRLTLCPLVVGAVEGEGGRIDQAKEEMHHQPMLHPPHRVKEGVRAPVSPKAREPLLRPRLPPRPRRREGRKVRMLSLRPVMSRLPVLPEQKGRLLPIPPSPLRFPSLSTLGKSAIRGVAARVLEGPAKTFLW